MIAKTRSTTNMALTRPSRSLYVSPTAATYEHLSSDVSEVQKFHKSFPNFAPTALTPLPSVATKLGVGAVYIKDESTRFGLPAYKILGASWGVYRAILARGEFGLDTPLKEISAYAREQRLVLFTATDGNHGRAVARMAAILGVKARVFVPKFTSVEIRGNIGGEGAEVSIVQGDYDAAVARAYEEAGLLEGEKGLFVQDVSFEGYKDIPEWIVQGYSTMLLEVEEQLQKEGLKADVLVTPIGAGSLADAVVRHSKSRARGIRVLAVEPQTAACVHESLKAGSMTSITTGNTIMDGMCCATPSLMSWAVLKRGIDASVTISDWESHQAIQSLHQLGVLAGPCGAGTLAGLRCVVEMENGKGREVLGLDARSVVVLLCTEGSRPYVIPEEVKP